VIAQAEGLGKPNREKYFPPGKGGTNRTYGDYGFFIISAGARPLLNNCAIVPIEGPIWLKNFLYPAHK
jgi:hypothetical protein